MQGQAGPAGPGWQSGWWPEKPHSLEATGEPPPRPSGDEETGASSPYGDDASMASSVDTVERMPRERRGFLPPNYDPFENCDGEDNNTRGGC